MKSRAQDGDWTTVVVDEEGERLGFAIARYEIWNRRAVLDDLFVHADAAGNPGRQPAYPALSGLSTDPYDLAQVLPGEMALFFSYPLG